jgi:exoribonuclease R
VLRVLDALPDEMAVAEHRAKKYERSIIDLMEVCLLAERVGEVFTGTVIEADPDHKRGVVMIKDPAIEARVVGDRLPLGHEVSVRLASADYAKGAVDFALA